MHQALDPCLAAAPDSAGLWCGLIRGSQLKAFLKPVHPVCFPAAAVSKPRIECLLDSSIPLLLRHHSDPSIGQGLSVALKVEFLQLERNILPLTTHPPPFHFFQSGDASQQGVFHHRFFLLTLSCYFIESILSVGEWGILILASVCFEKDECYLSQPNFLANCIGLSGVELQGAD